MKRSIIFSLIYLLPFITWGQNADSTDQTDSGITYEVLASSQYEDFGANLYGDKLIYVSSRGTKLFSDKYDLNNQKYFDLYLYDFADNSVSDYFLGEPEFNNKYHFGPSVLLEDSTGIFISRNYETPNKRGDVNFYLAYFSFADQTEYKLPFCSTEYSVQHPCYDSAKRRLYFSSNMAGKDGYDLFFVDWSQDGSWSEPVNMSNLNTSANEVFPTLSKKGLNFSKNSDHGDLDMFQATFASDTTILPLTLYNTKEDEFHLIELSGDSVVFSKAPTRGYNSDLILAYSVKENRAEEDFYYAGIIPIDTTRDIAQQADSLFLIYGIEFDSFVRGNDYIGFPIDLNIKNDSLSSNTLPITISSIVTPDSINWEHLPIERTPIEMTANSNGSFFAVVYEDNDAIPALKVLHEALKVEPNSMLFMDDEKYYVSGPKRKTQLQARLDSLYYSRNGMAQIGITESIETLYPMNKQLELVCIDKETKEPLDFKIDYYDYESQEMVYTANIAKSETLLISYLGELILGATITADEYLPYSMKIENQFSSEGTTSKIVVELTRIIEGVEQSFTLKNIHFDFDDYSLTPTAIRELEMVLPVLKRFESIKIIGHTDSKGSRSYNQRLSENRSISTMNYLSNRGISMESMTPIGKGEDQPVDTNETDEGRANNRRAEFIVK